MFDWFRKKKKTEPEAPAPEERNLVEDEAEEPEDQAAPEETAPAEPAPEPTPVEDSPPTEAIAAEPVPAEPEEQPTNAAEAEAAPELEQPAPKKGFFARFRKKASAPEKPEPEGPAEAASEPLGDEAAAESAPPALESVAEPEPATEEICQEEPAETKALEIIVEETMADELEAVESAAEAAPEEATEDEPDEAEAAEEADEAEDDNEAPRQGLFARFRDRLSATRDRLAGRIETLLSSVRAIDEDLLDELEELLITADLGVRTTNDLLFKIRGQVAKKELNDAEALKEALKNRIRELVELPVPPRPEASPMVIMVVGINGVGKTTSIAKLARRLKEDEGQKVLLAAGDTFRSAAVEQLGIWAERLGVDIVSQPTGADASAVVFDALTAARARQVDVVIIDTAGRLHTKVNLMDELKKIKRVAGKALPGAPHHTILVLDGNTGQNAMRQAQTFHEAVGVDSIIVTKLDGTAKGGVIVSITNELKIPIAFVGLGESFEDLQPFDAQAFTEAIVGS